MWKFTYVGYLSTRPEANVCVVILSLSEAGPGHLIPRPAILHRHLPYHSGAPSIPYTIPPRDATDRVVTAIIDTLSLPKKGSEVDVFNTRSTLVCLGYGMVW